ncbi:MAG: iron export ABC transporter permease subunit FetB [Planctomycetaceae bacterium]
MNTPELSYFDVLAAALLILLNGAISLYLQLGLGRKLAVAAVRTVVQLFLVGFVLEWVFQLQRWPVVLLLAGLMTVIAGLSAVGRSERRYPGMTWDSLLSMWLSCWGVSAYAIFVVWKGMTPWYHPQVVIPLIGMILGNSLNGVSLGLNRLTDDLSNRRDQIELLLVLGATRWEAGQGSLREALRTGMIPILNSMLIVGIVSLPGMMTGQILGGVSPIEAVKYQVVIMFLIAATNALGTLGVVLLAYRRLFNREHQFLWRQIETVRK